MIRSQHLHPLRLVGMVVLGGVVLLSIVLLRNPVSEAFPGMPADQQAYWQWVALINQDSTAALLTGEQLLQNQPDLYRLYPRYATFCAEADSVATCQRVIAKAQPTTALSQSYQEAAQIDLAAQQDDAVTDQWKALAQAQALDPTLARRIVDEARRDRNNEWIDELESQWLARYAADSSEAAIAFGLGYIANLFRDWDAAEPLLQRATELAPNDAQAYRELGRIYFFTGQPDAFNETLSAGIQAASNSYDLSQELILAGNLGLAYVRNGELDEAETLFQEALAQAKAIGDEETVGFNQYRLAGIYARQHRYDEVLALLDSAKVHYAKYAPQRQPEVMTLRGMTLQDLFRFSDAEQVLNESLDQAQAYRNILAEIEGSVSLAQLQYRMGRYGVALENGLHGLQLARRYRQADYEIAALLILGDIEQRWGNFETAEKHLNEGVPLATETGNTARLTELYKRLGQLALERQDSQAAQDYFDSAIEAERSQGESTAQAMAFLGLGKTYIQYENFEEGLRLHDVALQQLGPVSEETARTAAYILLGKAYAAILSEAPELARAALEEVEALDSSDPFIIRETDRAWGNFYLDKGWYAEAIQRFNGASEVDRDNQSREAWNTQLGLAIAHWRLGNHETAETHFNNAIEIVESLRDNLSLSINRSSFVQDKLKVYEYYADFLEDQGRSSEAFHYVERGRSRSLVDLLYTTQQERVAGAVSDPADVVVEMRRRMGAVTSELEALPAGLRGSDNNDMRGTRAAYLRREFRRADSLYREAQINLANTNELYTFRPVLADSVQDILKPNEALVAYDLRTLIRDGEEEEVAVAYIVLPDTLFVKPLGVRIGALDDQVQFFRDQISASNSGPGQGWETLARRMYDDLMRPVVDHLPEAVSHLHLVPKGILHYLPFAALLSAEGRFLVEDFTLSVSPSASVLKIARENNPLRWDSMLLVADPNNRLPGAQQEVRAIVAGDAQRRQALFGADATQDLLEGQAGNFDIIHFATHGNFIARSPWRSYLELYGDDVLSVADIRNLRLNAYLVTLSACETALSGGAVRDVPRGDEWVGFNQAFLAAGTPTVMASLWPIDDVVSNPFMVGFYEALDAQGKAYALAKTQRAFINHPTHNHPFYWAAFTVVGDPL